MEEREPDPESVWTAGPSGLDGSRSVRVEPGPPLIGRFRPPGSKSIAQRAIVCASLTAARTIIEGLPDADDVRHALSFARAMGATVENQAASGCSVVIEGHGPGPGTALAPQLPVALGESGTLARLALASIGFCALPERRVQLDPSGSLARRGSPALVAALRDAGVAIEGEGFELSVKPIGPPSVLRIERPSSSQEVTALWIALAAYPGEFELHVEGEVPSRPYLEITRRVLERFGARVESLAAANGEVHRIRGPLSGTGVLEVEADASAAAVGLAAGVLTGGRLCATGLGTDSIQGDVRILEHLAAFGFETESTANSLTVRGERSEGVPNRIEVALTGEPDLAPVLAAVGAFVARGGVSTLLTGLGTLPGKESSRIEVLARGLGRLGYSVEAGPAHLSIGPRERGARPAGVPHLDPAADHRMAFAFALLGLFDGPLVIEGPGCVAKSWPRFFDVLAELGAHVTPV